MEPKIEQQAKGTRILLGESAQKRRSVLNKLMSVAYAYDFDEIVLPTIEPASVYVDKAGEEILDQMYTLEDRKGRELCLRPEATATCQLLADVPLSRQRDVRLWYESRCFRYERPQAGRYREFTQFGIEVLNPKLVEYSLMLRMAEVMVRIVVGEGNYEVSESVKRGLDYYTEDGFEISVPSLGAQKQVCGGGKYEQGFGFAIGVDRLVLASKE